LRYEFIDQDQPRAGRDAVGVGEIPRHHDEVRTLNRNLIATLDYGFDAAWGVSFALPVVSRDHRHIHNHHGEKLDESWHFTRLGDARVLGRYQFPAVQEETGRTRFVGLLFGAKLPTGSFDVTNDEGEAAERTLQPGSGTTDAVLGASYREVLPALRSSWFAQVQVQAPLHSRRNYRPGRQAGIDLGWRYEATGRLGLVVQANYQAKGRDSGDEAEAEDSGSRVLSLSPGATYALDRGAQVYAFVQLPVYQNVNGVQLTADWSAVVGFATRF